MNPTFGRSAALGGLFLVAAAMTFSWAPHKPPHAAASSSAAEKSAFAPIELASSAKPASPEQLIALLRNAPGHAGGTATIPARKEWRRHFGDFEVGIGGQTLEEHLGRVRELLLERYGEAESEDFFESYARYANYQLALEQDVVDPAENPFEPEQGLARVAHQRAMAREMLGAEDASQLVEPDLARREYLLRRELVLSDPQQTAEEKTAAMAQLGPPPAHAAPIANNRLDEYHDALKLHALELSQCNDEEAERLKAKLRAEIFGPRLGPAGQETRN